jgi:lipoprotein-releasing system permease protein
MTTRSSFLLAFRYLFGERATADRRPWRRIRGGIIGVGLSLVPLVVVLQVADGMIAGITSRFIEAGSYHVQLISRADPDTEEVADTARRIAEVPGVTLATPEQQGLGLAAFGSRRTGVTIRAMEPDIWERDEGLRQYLEFSAGSWDLPDNDSILLGEVVAETLGVGVGETVRIVTARPLSGGRFLPRSASFTVRGVFSSGYQDLDRLWVVIPFARGRTLLPADVSRQIIGVKVPDPLLLPNPLYASRDPAARAAAERTVEELRDIGGTDWRVATWFQLERSKYMSFKTTKDLLVFIMVLIVLVAAVNISSALVMLVLEKQEEIAILKSMGASPRGIRRLFLVAGFVLGAAGTAAGIAVGLLLAVNINEVLYAIEWLVNAIALAGTWIARPFADLARPSIELLSGDYYLESIPIRIRAQDVLLIAGLTILLSTAAAYFPARRAARLRPLEILQKR